MTVAEVDVVRLDCCLSRQCRKERVFETCDRDALLFGQRNFHSLFPQLGDCLAKPAPHIWGHVDPYLPARELDEFAVDSVFYLDLDVF